MCTIQLKGRFKNILLVRFYASTEDADDNVKDDFYNQMENVINGIPRYDLKILMGDANANIGREDTWRDITGTQSLHQTPSKNGIKLLNLS